MEEMISILKTSLSVCIAFAILFFIISVILFFLFDIRTIFNIRTGRAKRKTVQEMQEANNRTGRLRVDGKTLTSQLSKEDRQRATKDGVKHRKHHHSKMVDYEMNSGYENTPPVSSQNDGDRPTEVLQQNYYEEYSLGSAPTSQLSEVSTAPTYNHPQIPIEKCDDIHFIVKKRVVIIHTNETLI